MLSYFKFMFENKNKLLALIIIVAIGVGIIFYVVWFILLNRGTIVFEGNPPFSVSIGPESQICLESSCSFSFAVQDYDYVISKEGYYTRSGTVAINRGKTISMPINLEYIPEALEGMPYTVFSLPVGYSKFTERLLDITSFHSFDPSMTLKKLPKKIEDIQFSSSGEKAIVFEKNDVSLYSTSDFLSKKLSEISDASSAGWTKDEKSIYTISFDDVAKKDALKKLNLEDNSIESLVYFLRDVDDYSISVSPDELFVAIADTTHSPNTLYIVDLQNKTRTNIFEGFVIEVGYWPSNSEVLIFSAKDEDQNVASLWYWDSITIEVNQFPFKSNFMNVDFSSEDELFFITESEFNVSGTSEPYFSEFIEEEEVTDYTLIFSEVAEPKRLTLQKWLYKQNETYLIKDLSESLPAIPDKIEVSNDNKIIRLLVEDKIFDIKLGE